MQLLAALHLYLASVWRGGWIGGCRAAGWSVCPEIYRQERRWLKQHGLKKHWTPPRVIPGLTTGSSTSHQHLTSRQWSFWKQLVSPVGSVTDASLLFGSLALGRCLQTHAGGELWHMIHVMFSRLRSPAYTEAVEMVGICQQASRLSASLRRPLLWRMNPRWLAPR